MPIEIRVVDSTAGIANVHARMPFRFGVITMRAAPLFTLAVTVEDRAGRRASGYAADLLAFRWFDKRPDKSLADNCRDLIRTVAVARGLYRDAGRDRYATPFRLFLDTHPEIERTALAEGFNRLGAAFGSSMLERAVIDAVGRLSGRSFFELVLDNELGVELGAISPELAGREVREFLPARPLERLHVRHTVGLVDPITAADIAEPVDDGLPETLEDYLERDGIGYLKIKVAGVLADDVSRLEAIAAVLSRRARPFRITLDGNEQYKTPADFLGLIERVKGSGKLEQLWRQVLFIEQPLDRAVALEPDVKPALEALSREKPVIIDEADGWLGAFKEAARLGYRGTSHKNCKGVYKSFHNLAFAAVHNAGGRAAGAVPQRRGSLQLAGRRVTGGPRFGRAPRDRSRRAQRPPLLPRPGPPVGRREGRGLRKPCGPLRGPRRRGVPENCRRRAGVRLTPDAGHGLCRAARHGPAHPARCLGLREPWPGLTVADLSAPRLDSITALVSPVEAAFAAGSHAGAPASAASKPTRICFWRTPQR